MQAEMLRRGAGLPQSGAGIPGGMPATNAAMPANPIANAGMNNLQLPQQTGQGMPPAGSNMSTGPLHALNGAHPNEAQSIVSGLLRRLAMLSRAEGQPPNA